MDMCALLAFNNLCMRTLLAFTGSLLECQLWRIHGVTADDGPSPPLVAILLSVKIQPAQSFWNTLPGALYALLYKIAERRCIQVVPLASRDLWKWFLAY